MKIDLVSDLHLEFFEGWNLIPNYDKLFKDQGSETLIIAGDTMTCLASDCNDMAEELFFDVTTRYRNVLCVLGNHDYWNRSPWANRKVDNFDTMQKMCELRYPDVTFLSPSTPFTLKDTDGSNVRFIGDTLWTNPRPENRFLVARRMNDYQEIYGMNGELITLDDTVNAHIATLGSFKQTLMNYPNDRFVVVTHHLPIHLGKYKADRLNDAYATDLSNFILDNPNVRLWCAGHSHESVEGAVGNCRIVSNPHGYVMVEHTEDYKVRTFEV